MDLLSFCQLLPILICVHKSPISQTCAKADRVLVEIVLGLPGFGDGMFSFDFTLDFTTEYPEMLTD